MRGTVAATSTRRHLLAVAPTLAWPGLAHAAAPDFATIEHVSGGRLGVFALDTGSGATLAWRADQRFPFCSSFKALLAAFVLAKVDRGDLRLDQAVPYGPGDLLDYAPIAKRHVGAGSMTVSELCAAAVSYSDNTAANLLLRLTGGPAALAAWVRGTGDPAFRLSHNETALNLSRFGDETDTTTPRAMAGSLRRLCVGALLKPSSRALLTSWLVANATGARRLRAGLPTGWRIGDKTGTWSGGWASTIDVAVAWPPGRAPLVIAGFVTDTTDTKAGETALASVGRTVAQAFVRG